MIYYVISRTTEGVMDDYDTPPVILYVTDAETFNRTGYQTDYTPLEVFTELEAMGYSASECMEGMVEVAPINNTYSDLARNQAVDFVKSLKQDLASSSVFKYSQEFCNFMKDHSGDDTV
jgi:hypothetical protein